MGRGVFWLMLAPSLALSDPSYSQEFTGKFVGYYCTVQSAYKVDSGVLSPSGLAASFVGHPFLVERSTGQVSGSLFETDSWEGEKILDPGSNTRSYKVIYATPPNVSVRLLVVSEYQEALMKEFVLVDNLNVYSGQCEHKTVKWRRIETPK